VPSSTLRRRLRGIESYAPHTFDTTTGPGSLLFDVIRNAPSRLSATDPEVAREMGRIIIDLLLLTLEADPNVLGSQLGSVQKGHVARMQAYIRRNLADPSLTPETVAQSCGISTRYLHGLFRSSGTTVSRWILDQRLEACHADLAAGIGRSSVAEIAFRWGFSDHAHFSRHYKRRFGITPRERRQARALVGREEAVLF
jgi:AraC-like DNA-binding protein